jgi:two-component system nitrogen regulation sensor histidine kinase NtrY
LGAQGKIRIMLALLCASLSFTALIVKKTYTTASSLGQTGKLLEHNLQEKEALVNAVINDPHQFNELKKLGTNSALSLKYIQRFTSDKNMWFITTLKDSLAFWSGIKIIPDYPGVIKEGYSFRKESNGFYEVIKKSEGDFSVIFFIPVKLDYPFQNHFLKNTFATDLLTDDNIEIADFTDKPVFEIRSSNKSYLFSVKLKDGETNLDFFYFELSLWISALIVLCVLIQSISLYIVSRGFYLLSFLFLAAFIVGLRFVNLHYGWPDFTYRLKLFDPELYGSSYVYPSLGDFCINILFITWFVVFLYIQRKRLFKNIASKLFAYGIFLSGIALLLITSTAFLYLFYGLVLNSKINFDISNVLNLSGFSFLGVLMLCFAFLIFFLLSEVFITVAIKLPIANRQKVLVFIGCIALASAFAALRNGFPVFYLLWAVLVLSRAYAYRYLAGLLDSAAVAIIIIICAVISAVELNYFESVKELTTRKAFIQQLEAPDDPAADLIFKKNESQILSDTAINAYFRDSVHNNSYVSSRLEKLYFNGYLSKYALKVYPFDKNDRPLSADRSYGLDGFKDLVLYSSRKVSNFFYRENESFGFLSYFAILPIHYDSGRSGTIVIELKSKPIQTAVSFPELLEDEGPGNRDEFKGYSYAFYNDNRLVTQSGSYIYDIQNTQFDGSVGKYGYRNVRYSGDQWYKRFTWYRHLIYKPSTRTLIVVSKEDSPIFFAVTALTFFFVVLLIFSVTILLIRWLWLKIRILSIKNDRIKWNFKYHGDFLLYKTRIQFSMVFAVVATLITVGFITFFSLSSEYQRQQDETTRQKVNKITTAFENGQYTRFLGTASEQSQVAFDEFANTYSADLTLFDLDGVELITTEPKIYESGLQARRMNARAYINLASLNKSEFTNEEKIGLLTYRAAFKPIRNSTGETIAYLELPYFSNESDYREHIGELLNILINVYAVVFMGIGLFAIFIARQITAPLSVIQESLSKTIYGKKNEPVKWERNDEIGALVKEYNKMIAALENSAQKLAQSERESAWREMAKQVAHEIKNPLTPLKLGLQLLDKSWRDKDPKFDQKFERFSKSFVEQIESLSSIASEFSAFAKMPETRLERINLFNMINQAVTIFKEMDNISITYEQPEAPFYIRADRDQLLRCFNNLLKNAIEATRSDNMGLIDIKYVITSKTVLVTIKDNGDGIPEGLREKIFEPNFTTKSSGTGLGLAFVKNSIENAGGKVWFETKAGVGTTFYISLPAD